MKEEKKDNYPLVSVIIPVYKVEAFLLRCLNSVSRQKYPNLEIILVDDGSPDSCGAICEEYASRDSRFRVFHKTNGGLSDARNYGVAHCNGDYITFIDSDDYVSDDYVEYLYSIMVAHGADAAVCCHQRTSTDDLFTYDHADNKESFAVSGVEACRLLFDHDHAVKYDATAWARLYKAEIVRDNPFPVGRLFEDIATTPKYYAQCRSIAFGEKICYAYYVNPKGIMGAQSRTPKALEDYIWVMSKRSDFYAEYGYADLEMKANAQFFNGYALRYLLNTQRRDTRVTAVFRNRHISLKCKAGLALYRISPALFRIIWTRRNGENG